MWGLLLAAVLMGSAFVASSRMWGSRPSRNRIMLSTLAAVLGAMVAWILTEQFVGLSEDRDVKILTVMMIVLAAATVRLGLRRVVDPTT